MYHQHHQFIASQGDNPEGSTRRQLAQKRPSTPSTSVQTPVMWIGILNSKTAGSSPDLGSWSVLRWRYVSNDKNLWSACTDQEAIIAYEDASHEDNPLESATTIYIIAFTPCRETVHCTWPMFILVRLLDRIQCNTGEQLAITGSHLAHSS